MTQEEREARALTTIIDSFDRRIWEGWTVWDFIEALRPELDLIMTGRSIYKPFTSKKALECVHIKIASKIIASCITAINIMSSLS